MDSNKGNNRMINKLELSTECMCEDRFWELVALAKWPCDYKKMNIKYRKMLNREECIAFRATLSKARSILDTAICSLPLGCGDDGYSDLKNHIVGLGKKEYYKHLNDTELVQDMADNRSYVESYSYCLPYDSDYEDSEKSKYDIKSIISITQHAKEEIEQIWKLDKKKGVEHLFLIRDELDCLHSIMGVFLECPNELRLENLVKEKAYVTKYCKKIEKFFDNNYMELPRKFTEGNRFCTAIFENTINDAEILLEFLKTDQKELA